MNSIINLYVYMNSCNEIVKKLDKLSIEEFIRNEEIVSAYFAIFKELVGYLVNLDPMFNIASDFTALKKEIYEADALMLNSYKLVNANMLYDFFKGDYRKLFKMVCELVK